MEMNREEMEGRLCLSLQIIVNSHARIVNSHARHSSLHVARLLGRPACAVRIPGGRDGKALRPVLYTA